MSSSSCFPIKLAQLEEKIESANGYLRTITWTPGKYLQQASDDGKSTSRWVAHAAKTPPDDTLSILELCQEITKDSVLFPEGTNLMLQAIRTGICLGLHLADQYRISSGLKELDELNKVGQLSTTQSDEFNSKKNTMCAIALYTASSYIVWKLGSYKPEKVSSTIVAFNGIPEITLKSTVAAMKCLVYWFGSSISSRQKFAGDEIAMIAVALKYFGGVMDTIKQREASLKFSDFFTNVSYKLEDSDFGVSGFNPQSAIVAVTQELNPVDINKIVGNTIAKYEAVQRAKRVCLYNFKAKRNPLKELGGFRRIFMAFGDPGCGKTMLLCAEGTEMMRLCNKRGVPFLNLPLPENVISTFQGGSAERGWAWISHLGHDDKIMFLTIDDGENNLEDRNRPGVSSGVREFIGTVLRGTEGSASKDSGNSAFGIYTNLPGQIDKAPLSRVQCRYEMEGAKTAHDFLDQDYLWWKQFQEDDPAFINMNDPADYIYMSDQVLPKNLVSYETEIRPPSDPWIRAVYEGLLRRGLKLSDHKFFGEFFAGVKQIYKGFTSRDLRNIQQAITGRINDFDIPEVWFDDPREFFDESYERQVEILKSLRRENMKGLSFKDIRHIEVVRYLDTLATIVNVDRERKIAAFIEDMEIREEAAARYAAARGK